MGYLKLLSLMIDYVTLRPSQVKKYLSLSQYFFMIEMFPVIILLYFYRHYFQVFCTAHSPRRESVGSLPSKMHT